MITDTTAIIMGALITVMEVGMLPGGGIGTTIRMVGMNLAETTVGQIVLAEVGAGGVASSRLCISSFLFQGLFNSGKCWAKGGFGLTPTRRDFCQGAS